MFGIEWANIFSSSRRINISSTSSLLRIHLLFSFKINGTSSKTPLLQYFGISFSILHASFSYKGEADFINLFVVRPQFIHVWYDQGRNFSFVFIKKLFSVSRRIMLLSRFSRNRLITFMDTSFSSCVFSSFCFYFLYTPTSSSEQICSSFTR